MYLKLIKLTTTVIFTLIILNSCAKLPGGDAKKNPPNPKQRVAKNLSEGKGFRINNKSFKGSTNFEFASSNELWRASLDTIDFIPLASANYSGGILITDWYSDDNASNESIKITIRFLSNEIRADGLIVQIHKRSCNNNGNNCNITEIKNELIFDIKDKIIRKAAIFKVQSDKIAKENKPTKVFKAD